MVHGYARPLEDIHLQVHHLIQICKSTALRVVQESRINLLSMLAQMVDEEEFRRLDIYANREDRNLLVPLAVDDARIAERIPQPLFVEEFLLLGTHLLQLLFLLLEFLLQFFLAADVCFHAVLNDVLEKLIELHNGRSVQKSASLSKERIYVWGKGCTRCAALSGISLLCNAQCYTCAGTITRPVCAFRVFRPLRETTSSTSWLSLMSTL
ncbi:MAG: hypothetical protein UY90_C0093G0006 [Candidatus Peregrinibacteria bacterium GW2011_GWA2_54_9]|nr:MAG: hypothetical protein UY90_C0093G0006 [Candidatus Peregrinibacteria bacterium GW2011_GWA2_54_9]